MNQKQFVIEVFRIMREDGPLISEGDKLFWREGFGSGLDQCERQDYDRFYGATFGPNDFIDPEKLCSSSVNEVLNDYYEFAGKLREEEKQGAKSKKIIYAAQMAFMILMSSVLKMYRV